MAASWFDLLSPLTAPVKPIAPAGSALGLVLPLIAMVSPWWEDYGIKESFLCRDRVAVEVERNDAQASLISGQRRLTLFRDERDLPGLRFSNGQTRLILEGDELTLEQPMIRLSCIRTGNA
ncbi:MAG: hypothetical protein ACKOCM_08105 [Cyanobacteriota bacterium]